MVKNLNRQMRQRRQQKRPTITSYWMQYVGIATSLFVIFCNVAWQFGAIQSSAFEQDTQNNASAKSVLPTELKQEENDSRNRRQLLSEAAKQQQSIQEQKKKYEVNKAKWAQDRTKKAGKFGPPQWRMPTPRRQQYDGPVNLTKPAPAIMCASKLTAQQCQIEACSTGSNALNTSLPELMKPYPAPHYGYGFVDRTDPSMRGVKMQIPGAAKAGSGCAISHKYKFIFVHVLKSGGTTMKGFLQEALCGNTSLPCAHGLDTLQIVNCAATIQQHPHYLVFGFVRNPYSRMYSAYAMAHEYRGHPTKPKDPFSFETFAMGVAAPPTTDTTTYTAFAELDKTGATVKQQDQQSTQPIPTITKNKFRKLLSYLHPSHYEPQTKYLFTPTGCPVVDFIGHLETMHEDLEILLGYLDSPELWEHLRAQSASQKEKKKVKTDSSTAFGSRLGGSLQTAFRYNELGLNDHGTPKWSAIQKAVYLEHQRDFHLLGYNPDLMPS